MKADLLGFVLLMGMGVAGQVAIPVEINGKIVHAHAEAGRTPSELAHQFCMTHGALPRDACVASVADSLGREMTGLYGTASVTVEIDGRDTTVSLEAGQDPRTTADEWCLQHGVGSDHKPSQECSKRLANQLWEQLETFHR